MAKDTTTRIVNGVPTLVTTSDNIEDFQNLADSVVVGSAVMISGENEVSPADQANGDIAIGLVFEVTSTTTCRVITHGQFDGYPAVLVPGSVYFLGESGGLLGVAPQSGTQQMIGFAVSTSGLFVHPDVSAILRGVAGGTPSLDTDGKIAQLPSAAAPLPGPGRIPVADANGRLDAWVSSGTSVQVNASTGSIDINNAQPVAPASGLNVLWQQDTSSPKRVSAYIPLTSINRVGTIVSGTWNGTPVAVTYGGTGAADATTARANLGLTLGTQVQPYDAQLTALANVTASADKVPYFTGAGSADVADLSQAGRALIAALDQAGQRAVLGLGSQDALKFAGLSVTGERADFGANYLRVNSNYLAGAPQTGGLLVQYVATTSTSILGSTPTGFQVQSGTFATGDIVRVHGTVANDGVYEVSAFAPGVVTVNLNPLEGWCCNAVVAAPAAGTLTKIGVAVCRVNQGQWETATGSTLPLTYSPVLSTPGLSALATVTPVTGALPYFDTPSHASTTPITAAARSLLDDPDAATQRQTLGLAAVASSGQAGDLLGTLPVQRLPALTGDVEMLAGAGVLSIPDATVRYSQIQNLTGDVLLGRTSVPGVVEEIPLTAVGRTFLAQSSVDSQRSALALGLADSPTFAGLTVNGNLLVNGTKTFVHGEVQEFTNEYLTLNADYTGNTAMSVGLVTTLRAINNTSVTGSFVAGFGQTDARVTVADANLFVAHDLIHVHGATINNGFYEVRAVEGSDLVLKGFSVPPTELWCGYQLVNASVSGTVSHVQVSILRSRSSGEWEYATGSNTSGLGLVYTSLQRSTTVLQSLASLNTAANKLPYFASTGVASLADLSAYGRSLIAANDSTTLRGLLGLGSLATQSGSFSGTSSGVNTGDQVNIPGNAATVTTNANLTGVVTSVGNTTSIADGAILNRMLANTAVASLSGVNTGDQTAASLGVVPGVDVQPYSARLAGLAALTLADQHLVYLDNQSWAATPISTAGKALLASSGAAADKLAYYTGTTTIGYTSLTTFGRDLLAQGSVQTLQTTLGFGTVVPTLDISGRVVQNPATSSVPATADAIPVANSQGKLGSDWGGVAGSFATLDGSARVIQNPASATATPAPNVIPLADESGRLDAWVTGHPWHGKLMVTLGFGEPQFAHFALQNTAMTVSGPTPAGLTTSVGRLQYFLPAVSITVNRIRWHGIATVSNVYNLAIYRADTGARVWTSAVSTVSGTWSSTTTGLPITIQGGVPYWVGISASSSTGTTAGFRTLARPVSSSLGITSLPGNLSFYGGARYAQIAVTGGIWPATLPALSAASFATTGTTGTVPMLWLDNNPA